MPILQRVCLDNDYPAATVLLHVARVDVNATGGQGQSVLFGYLRRFDAGRPYAKLIVSHAVYLRTVASQRRQGGHCRREWLRRFAAGA